MDRSIIFIIAFILLSGLTYYFWQEYSSETAPPEPPRVVDVEIPPEPVVDDKAIRYPVAAPAETAPVDDDMNFDLAMADDIGLPALNESDAALHAALASHYAEEGLLEVFIFSDFIRHVVVTIDNMTTKKLPGRFVFTRSPHDEFKVSKGATENDYVLDERNFARYQPFFMFADAVDDRKLLSIYARYYPLFQQAYDELGYNGRYFNDRLVEVIDHLLQTPEVKGPVRLVRPKIFYQFADPALENLSAGQKILMRIGSDNARRVKARLQGLRERLTRLGPAR